MSLKSRLDRLEKMLGRGSTCPQCHGSPIQEICLYEEEPDGTLRLVSGTPPTPCAACGRMPSSHGISAIIAARPKETRDPAEIKPFYVGC
jgi:hypothetical protein